MNIALIGYGKMGKEIEKTALQRGHQVVCIIDQENPEAFQSEAFRQADVAIEFTSPTAAYDNCLKAFAAGVKVVSGSTGWLAAHEEEMRRLCAEQGKTLFWSSNFSLGVTIFTAINRQLARIMHAFPAYTAAMTETHHVHKLDAPSGTALTLADVVEKELGRDCPISSIRKGEVPGIHTIRYDSDADSITLTHDAKNRGGFALGAVLAAEFTATHEGFLGMEDLFPFLKS